MPLTTFERAVHLLRNSLRGGGNLRCDTKCYKAPFGNLQMQENLAFFSDNCTVVSSPNFLLCSCSQHVARLEQSHMRLSLYKQVRLRTGVQYSQSNLNPISGAGAYFYLSVFTKTSDSLKIECSLQKHFAICSQNNIKTKF